MLTMPDSTRLSDYDYELPRDLIAQQPSQQRGDSRLLVLTRSTGEIAHRRFSELPDYLRSGDVLVLNDTKVIPCRLVGRRASGGLVKALLVPPFDASGQVRALLEARGKLQPGERIVFENGELAATLIAKAVEGGWRVKLAHSGDLAGILRRVGRAPLPPYVHRAYPSEPERAQDIERYQTVYASRDGAIAAPTAGLHFIPDLLQKIAASGVEVVRLTLHVGLGTFQPVKTDDIRQHPMHAEWFEITEAAAHSIERAKADSRRIIAVGTTSCRVLEAIAASPLKAQSGWTSLFIYPPYQFRLVSALLTNFHLPRSTLLMLVSAFAGRETILNAYEAAKREGYRFYSYGDAMLIL